MANNNLKITNQISLNSLHWVIGEQELGPIEHYLAKSLRKKGTNVSLINIHSLYNKNWRKFSSYSHRFPRRYDNAVQTKYFNKINQELLKKYKEQKPSCIFIYNDCMVMPETIEFFKKNGTKIIIFLGDDPNYLFPAKKTFLLTVMNADIVILPDTGWIEGLKMLGLKNIFYSPYGTDTEVFFKMQPENEDMKKYKSEYLFIGTGYFLNSWGIRRAALLNEFAGLNFKLFGDKLWLELFPYFPELKKHFIPQQLYSKDVNIACNCSKIYPVIVNAGVINGVSTRIFDCIASGIFVLAEYRKDLDMLFPNKEIITFRSKKELKDKAAYFLKNENERLESTECARKVILEKYTFDVSVLNILEYIK